MGIVWASNKQQTAALVALAHRSHRRQPSMPCVLAIVRYFRRVLGRLGRVAIPVPPSEVLLALVC